MGAALVTAGRLTLVVYKRVVRSLKERFAWNKRFHFSHSSSEFLYLLS